MKGVMMDKIKKRKRERVNEDIWIEAYYDINDVADKLNELVEGYNELSNEGMENNTSINYIMEWIREHDKE